MTALPQKELLPNVGISYANNLSVLASISYDIFPRFLWCIPPDIKASLPYISRMRASLNTISPGISLTVSDGNTYLQFILVTVSWPCATISPNSSNSLKSPVNVTSPSPYKSTSFKKDLQKSCINSSRVFLALMFSPILLRCGDIKPSIIVLPLISVSSATASMSICCESLLYTASAYKVPILPFWNKKSLTSRCARAFMSPNKP